MAAPSEKLATSLEALKTLQDKGYIAIHVDDLSRTHRERLIKTGFLEEVIKGWYIPTRQPTSPGENTAWYASFWDFCAGYLNKRFNKEWCLSPEQSISIHAGNWRTPQQLVVRSPMGNNNIIQLPHHTSLIDMRCTLPDKNQLEEKNKLRIYNLVSALIACSPRFFNQHPTDARTALSLIQDSSDLLRPLLDNGHSSIASRLAGAFRNIGRNEMADDIIKTMSAAGYSMRETDPFETPTPVILSSREKSPYVNRLRIMWEKMRHDIIGHFPKPSGRPKTIPAYLKQVHGIYATDAYHSLSIEGYQVSNELIEQVRSGKWNPTEDKNDRKHVDALAARGYWLAFKAVEKSIHKVLKNMNPGEVFSKDHKDWFREMFSPCVTAGIISESNLAGYRTHQVYIRSSKHVPPNTEAVRDLMPALSDLLCEEQDPAVRIVLGHFFFVYIHPYMDGNGRTGRFLMNLMFAAGRYPWLVIPVQQRSKYFAALEEASTNENIVPFRKFLAELLAKQAKHPPTI